jgi:hypothetical protein
VRRYSKEIKEFIAINVIGCTTVDLAKLVNDKFGTDFTESKMKSYKNNHDLKSGTFKGRPKGHSEKYPKEIHDYICENSVGRLTDELTELINRHFNTNYSINQIRAYKKNHKISSGVSSQFQKGQTSYNKGKKGLYTPGSEKGWFKLGNIPNNHRPVGSERIDSKDGYTLIKTAEPNIWELKHKVIYEKAYGKLPEGYVVTFLDGDKTNIELNNLEAITMAESAALTKLNLRFNNSELTKTGIMIVKVKQAKNNLIKSKRTAI